MAYPGTVYFRMVAELKAPRSLRRRVCGKPGLPLPHTFTPQPTDWEEWSWKVNACMSMFENGAVTLLDRADLMNDEFTDENVAVTRMLNSPRTGYFSPKDSAKLIFRRYEDSNGFEAWRKLFILVAKRHPAHVTFDAAFRLEVQPRNFRARL